MQWTVAIGVDSTRSFTLPWRSTCWGLGSTAARSRPCRRVTGACLLRRKNSGVPAFAVEGTGSYGAGLVRFLEAAGVNVFECERPRRQERRRGKSI